MLLQSAPLRRARQERMQLQPRQRHHSAAAATVISGHSGGLWALQPQQCVCWQPGLGGGDLSRPLATLVWVLLQRLGRGCCVGQCCAQHTPGPRVLLLWLVFWLASL